MKKRGHHYVWKYYLSAWGNDEKIWCHREGKTFNSSTDGIGKKRDFYKLKELSIQDTKIIKKYFIDTTYPHLQKMNEKWIEIFSYIHNLKNELEKQSISGQQLDNFIDAAIYNFEEDLHGKIEEKAIKYLDSIKKEDVSFFQNNKGCISFSHYLAVQFLRTEKVKLDIIHSMETMDKRDPDFKIEKIWNVVSHILATNMAWSIFESTVTEKPYKIILLKNNNANEFITGDQPVVNIYKENNNLAVKETELYYPVSPKLGVLITKNKAYKAIAFLELSVGQVKYYNRLIIQNSRNQIYASTKRTIVEAIGE